MAITNTPNVVVTNPRLDGMLDGLNNVRVLKFAEGDNQTFKAGEFVILSSGKIITATPGTAIVGPADVFGIAMQDASNNTLGNAIRVAVLKPGSEVIMSLADLTGVNTGNYLEPAVSHIGTTVSVVKETGTGKWVANVNAAGTAKSFQIIGTVGWRSGDKIDSTKSAYGAAVICRVITSALQNE